LGIKTTQNKSKPVLVKELVGRRTMLMAAGWNHSLVLTENGDLWAAGYGAHGQLGFGDKESKTSFTVVGSVANKNIDKIFAGGAHSWIVLNSMNPIRESGSQLTIVNQQQHRDYSPSQLIPSFNHTSQFEKLGNSTPFRARDATPPSFTLNREQTQSKGPSPLGTT
jgi:alpha-tubulin suppressor-like RCC1 family protein